MFVADGAESDAALVELIRHLHQRIQELAGSLQLNLFNVDKPPNPPLLEPLAVGESVDSLHELVSIHSYRWHASS
jgi:hypothetical protein